MADPVLISPATRPFGWAMTDLTLYGGQPLPDMAIGKAEDDHETGLFHPSSTEQVPASPPEADIAAGETDALLEQQAHPALAPGPSALAPSVLASPFSQAHAADAPTAIPALSGSGEAAPLPVATPLQTVEAAGHHNPPSAQPPEVDLAPASADVAAPPLSVPTLIAPIAGMSEALASPIAHAADAAVSPVLGVVDLLDSQIAGVANAVASQVHDMPDTVTATLGDATGAVMPIVDSLPIESFAGTDPAAGLTTLVTMVESADAFDIGHALSSSTPDASPGFILDTLTADQPVGALLGHSEDDGGHHLIDDHGIHVGL